MFQHSFRKFIIPAALLFSVAAPIAHSQTAADPKPRLYLSSDDITRLREQSKLPEFSKAYADVEKKVEKNVADWLKKYPVPQSPRSTEELIELGKRDNPLRDYKTVATAYALHPTPELGRVLREKLLSCVGSRRIKVGQAATQIFPGNIHFFGTVNI